MSFPKLCKGVGKARIFKLEVLGRGVNIPCGRVQIPWLIKKFPHTFQNNCNIFHLLIGVSLLFKGVRIVRISGGWGGGGGIHNGRW